MIGFSSILLYNIFADKMGYLLALQIFMCCYHTSENHTLDLCQNMQWLV